MYRCTEELFPSNVDFYCTSMHNMTYTFIQTDAKYINTMSLCTYCKLELCPSSVDVLLNVFEWHASFQHTLPVVFIVFSWARNKCNVHNVATCRLFLCRCFYVHYCTVLYRSVHHKLHLTKTARHAVTKKEIETETLEAPLQKGVLHAQYVIGSFDVLHLYSEYSRLLVTSFSPQWRCTSWTKPETCI